MLVRAARTQPRQGGSCRLATRDRWSKKHQFIKNPLVLEFEMEVKPVDSESELETAIIDRLQRFLLELGNGFLFEAWR